MRKPLRSLTRIIGMAMLTGVVGMGSASAAIIIDSSTMGYYNDGLGDLSGLAQPANQFPAANCGGGCNAVTDPTINPAAEPTILGPNIGTWLTNAAPTGGTWSAGLETIPSSWAVNTETAIVYELQGGDFGLSNLHIDLGVDNGIFVWLNGDYLFGALNSGGANINEYDISVASVDAGMNYLQILREDHGGGTGYMIQVSGDRNEGPGPNQIPLPASILLLGGGLGLLRLGARARR